MLRTDQILVTKEKSSHVSLKTIQLCIEEVLQKNASAIKYRIVEEEKGIKVILERPISFQTVNKILLAFDEKRMKLLKVTLNREEIGPFIRGHLEVIVS